MNTECSYDHIYVYDGETYDMPQLGVFSGHTIPEPVTATSGSMLILLYSDTNYALSGFMATYSVTSKYKNHCVYMITSLIKNVKTSHRLSVIQKNHFN